MLLEKEQQIVVKENGLRIDKYLANYFNLSRSVIEKIIADKCIKVNNILVRKKNFFLKINQIITIDKFTLKNDSKIKPEKLALNVVFEDEHIIVINKQNNLVVHPAPGNLTGTLINGLVYYLQNNLSYFNESTRPGLVHRIDKNTTGLLIVAKTNLAHEKLLIDLKAHHIQRIYLALVEGNIENDILHLNLPIARDVNNFQKMSVSKLNAKDAITHVFVEKRFVKKTLVRCELETGRTHQIRVHLSYIGHPIFGDSKYGKYVDEFEQRLHAFKLIFKHPISGKKMIFEAPLPKQFKNDLK